MSTSYDIEICAHCGSEFEVGYWRNDLSLCEQCMSMAHGLNTEVDGIEVMDDDNIDLDLDDWSAGERYAVDELGLENTIGGY